MGDAPIRFVPADAPRTRILLMLGQHQIGAVFPPSRDPSFPQIWNWGFWLGSMGSEWTAGHAKTEQAAKNAVLAKAKDWLRDAGLQP